MFATIFSMLKDQRYLSFVSVLLLFILFKGFWEYFSQNSLKKDDTTEIPHFQYKDQWLKNTMDAAIFFIVGCFIGMVVML